MRGCRAGVLGVILILLGIESLEANQLIHGGVSSIGIAAGTLVITDPVTQKNHQVVPPVNGGTTSSPVVISGTYTGDAPTNVACQTYQLDGTTVIQTWTTLSAETIAAGNWTGTLTVAFTPQNMLAQCRKTQFTSVVTAVTTNDFGVGPTPLIAGQSQVSEFWDTADSTVSPNTATWRYAGSTAAVNAVQLTTQAGEPDIHTHGQGALELSNLLTGQLNSASMLLQMAVSGVSSLYWISPTGTGYTRTITAVTNLGNTFDLVIWNQGQSDTLGGGTTYATYLANLRNVEAWTQGLRANVPFFITPIGQAAGVATDAHWEAVKQALLTSIDTDSNVFFGGMEVDLPYVAASTHLTTTGRFRYAKRIMQAYMRYTGLSTSGYGPTIDQANATWDGNVTVTIPILQEGAATLTCGALSTSCSAITGFRVFDNGSPATISSTALSQPNQVILTLSATPSQAPTVDYLYGEAPTATNAVYDNQAPFSDTAGLPLQPSRGLGSTGHFTAN